MPPRRTFSSGQRALLWAAGVLGALAIVIAILIVLNAQDRKDREPPPPTVTNTDHRDDTVRNADRDGAGLDRHGSDR